MSLGGPEHEGVSPGWFTDPSNPSQLRYWDGVQWTNHTHTAQPGSPEEPMGEALAAGARKAWAATLAASKRARELSAPVISAAAQKTKETWDRSVEEIAQRRASSSVSPPSGVPPGHPLPAMPPPAAHTSPAAHAPPAVQTQPAAAAPPAPPIAPAQPGTPGVPTFPAAARPLPLPGFSPQPTAPQPTAPSPAAAARPRRPLTIYLAMLCWSIAGALLTITPFVATAILRAQYAALKSEAGIAQGFLESGEQFARDVGGAAFGWVATLFITASIVSLMSYIAVIVGVARGSTVARVFGTVLAAFSLPMLASSSFAHQRLSALLSWADIDALTFTGWVFPTALALHLAGVVLVWLPPSHTYSRSAHYHRLMRGPLPA